MKFIFCFLAVFITALGFANEELMPLENFQERLTVLKSHIHRELEILDYPRRPWLQESKRSDGAHIYDVVIVGGGQTGLTLAFALRKEKVTNLMVFDENPEWKEGPWLTYARMQNLRSPKYVIGPDCNVPSLTCQAWVEAKYGEEQWMKLMRIPRKVWADYLHWFKKTLELPVTNSTKVGALSWDAQEQCFVVPIQSDGKSDVVFAKKVVMATGFQGSGEWTVPAVVKDNLPSSLYTSVYQEVDFEKLRDKNVAVLGGGPCAFDNAIMAHDHGAKEIHMFFKRPKLVNLHMFRWGEFVGFLAHFPDLPDSDKWKFVSKMFEIGQPPTPEGVAKIKSMNNVFFHFESPWIYTEEKDGLAVIHTPKEVMAFDHLLVATGWIADLPLRPELKEFCNKIATWADRYTPPPEHNYPILLRMPYLGRHFEFMEKEPGTAPYVNSIFSCTGGSWLSMGFSAGTGLIGMKYSIQRIVRGIVGELFLENKDYYYSSMENYNDPIFDNDL